MFQSPTFRSRTVIVIAVTLTFFLAAHLLFGDSLSSRLEEVPENRPSLQDDNHRDNVPAQHDNSDPPCLSLPRAENAVVIMRTGATEVQDKLPIHFNTTFKCYTDLIIFSDYEETFQGHLVHDVLANVDKKIKAENDDFEIYRRLQKEGHAGLQPEELSGTESFEGGKGGKKENPGWRLDKWKFLPMMKETLKLRPDMDWYIFVETDTYVVWSNMLQWLKELDPSEPLYYGSENQIGPDIYAHGGSAFVMSRSAVQKAADAYTEKEERWNEWTARHWAGDCVLGKLLLEEGVRLTWSWPMFQGGNPEKMDFAELKGREKRLWCAPALSYHHFNPEEMLRIWNFEQNWIRSRLTLAASENRQPWQTNSNGNGEDILHHRDVFKSFILPNITTSWQEWDNKSPDMIMAGKEDFDACYQLCEQSPECLQFSVGPPGCAISTREVMLGERSEGMKSYWVMDRIERWMENLDECDGVEGWPVP